MWKGSESERTRTGKRSLGQTQRAVEATPAALACEDQWHRARSALQTAAGRATLGGHREAEDPPATTEEGVECLGTIRSPGDHARLPLGREGPSD